MKLIRKYGLPVHAMDRRAAILLAVLIGVAFRTEGPRAADKIARIGFLGPRSRSDVAAYYDAFLRGLRELGWTVGRNLVIEDRWAEGKSERLPELASELVRLNVEVIVAGPTAAAVAAKNATKVIPIVFATAGDPVGLGLVASLAHPGGNVTGMSFSVGMETFGKELELLKEAIPSIRRIAVLSNPNNPQQPEVTRRVQAAAQVLGLEIQFYEAWDPNGLDRAFNVMMRNHAEALLVIADPILGFHRKRLAELAARNRLPTMYGLREHTEVGGLMSYSVDVGDNFRRCATYVDKILKGAKPADLPVEQPSKFELVINGKTAKALGITLPQSLLLRADSVIE